MTDPTKALSEFLQPCLLEGSQNTTAMEWLRRWEEDGGKKLSPATVESRLSDLLAERERGVRFFFSDPARTAILVDVLGLEPSMREKMAHRAEALLERGERRTPRTVLDLSTFPNDWASAEALFRAIKDDLLDEPHLLPMMLIMLEDQYDRLPRSFDDLGRSLEYVKVATPEEGREVIERRIDDEVTMLSSWSHQPYHRWLAIEFDGSAIRYGPPDGLAQLKARGRLPAPPTVERLAEELLDGPVEASGVQLPTGAVALRRIVDQVGDPARCSELGGIEARILIAREMGLRAAYSKEELQAATRRRERARIEGEIEEALVNLPEGHQGDLMVGSQAELEEVLAQARRVGVASTVMRVDDTIHLITGAQLASSEHPRLIIHSVERAPNALEVLLDAVESMTIDEWRDDPLLIKTIKRLAGDHSEDQKRLLHARATILLGAEPKPAKSKPLIDWRKTLSDLLKNDPPEAALQAQVQTKTIEWIGDRLSIAPIAYPDGRMFLKIFEDAPLQLYWVPPLISPLLKRAHKLVVFTPIRRQNDGYFSSGDKPPEALIPITKELARSHERWFEFAEGSPWLGADRAAAGQLFWKHRSDLMPRDFKGWNQKVIDLDESLWLQADLQLAAAWLVLRRAACAGDTVQLHDGRVLLELGGGVLAVIEARRHGEVDEAISAALRLPLVSPDSHYQRDQIFSGSLTTRIDTHTAITTYGGSVETRLGFSCPHGVMIRGGGAVFEIRFQATPLMVAAFGDRTSGVALGTGATAAVIQAAAEDDG